MREGALGVKEAGRYYVLFPPLRSPFPSFSQTHNLFGTSEGTASNLNLCWCGRCLGLHALVCFLFLPFSSQRRTLTFSLPPPPPPEPESHFVSGAFVGVFAVDALEAADWIWKDSDAGAQLQRSPPSLQQEQCVPLCPPCVSLSLSSETWKSHMEVHRRQTIPASHFKTLWRRKRSDLVCALCPPE